MITLHMYFYAKHENFLKISLNIHFLDLSEEFPRDSKMSSNHPL